jgi:hypothetical protein
MLHKPPDPKTEYIVKKVSGPRGLFAVTVHPYVDPLTGISKLRRVTWGFLDEDLVFTPSRFFFKSTYEQRARLLFPENWDLSKAYEHLGDVLPQLSDYCKDCAKLHYGHIWLLEQVAIKTGIWEDLLVVFDDDRKMADRILTLAIYPYLEQSSYDRLAKWQLIVKSPGPNEPLTPSKIWDIAKSITEEQRIRIVASQAGRHDRGLFAPPISSWGPESVADYLKTDTGKSLWGLQDSFFEKMRAEAANGPGGAAADAQSGRLLIHFVTLILSSYMNYVWENTKLNTVFSSPLDLLDEMRLITHIKFPEGQREITPFSQAQLDICEAFRFEPLKATERHEVNNRPFEFKRYKPIIKTPRVAAYNGPKRKPGRPKKITIKFNEEDLFNEEE